jgi:4-oxalocrotonate tautomerase
MPYVNIQVVGKLSKDQKREIAKQISETLLNVANKPKDATYVKFDEVDAENWGVGDHLLADKS